MLQSPLVINSSVTVKARGVKDMIISIMKRVELPQKNIFKGHAEDSIDGFLIDGLHSYQISLQSLNTR